VKVQITRDNHVVFGKLGTNHQTLVREAYLLESFALAVRFTESVSPLHRSMWSHQRCRRLTDSACKNGDECRSFPYRQNLRTKMVHQGVVLAAQIGHATVGSWEEIVCVWSSEFGSLLLSIRYKKNMLVDLPSRKLLN
jgi:hypothetical protein